MLSLHLPSYGYTWEVAKHGTSVREARGDNQVPLYVLQSAQWEIGFQFNAPFKG